MTDPLARVWRCRCPGRHAAGFLAHLRATGVAEARALPGCLGWQILTRDLDNPGDPETEFTLITYWRCAADMAAFAGPDAGAARLYPGDEMFAIVADTRVNCHTLRERTADPSL